MIRSAALISAAQAIAVGGILAALQREFQATSFQVCGLEEVSRKDWAGKVPNVPIYIVSGDKDPVGGMGKGVREVCDRLVRSGKTHVVLQLYKGGRHEMHNETNSDEVLRGIAAFLRGNL